MVTITGQYPIKQTVMRACDEGSPYSMACSFSSWVAVTLLTGGEHGRGADTTSYIRKYPKRQQLNQLNRKIIIQIAQFYFFETRQRFASSIN
jgi:hypothetical protein